MTDQELIARLREDVFYGDERLHNLSRHNPLHMEAADRIEALVKERDEALNQLDSARHSVDVLEKRLTDKMAKLDKAVKTLQILKPLLGDSWVDRRVLAVLAELEVKE